MSGLFNFETVLRAGAISGTVIFILLLLARSMRICSVNYLMLLGSVFTKRIDSGTEMVGFLTHLAMSVILALGYATVFALWHSSSWWQGALLAIPHLVLVAIITLILVLKTPSLREKLWPFYEDHHPLYNLFIIIVLHVVFGITNGIFFQG